MRLLARVLATAAPLASIVFACAFTAGSSQNPNANIGVDYIVTAAPVYEPLAALRGQVRFPEGAQLLLVHGGHADPLIEDFAATADADVSFDAKSVLFAGKKSASDPWQIWEFTFADHRLRKIVADANDAVRPLYLPAGRLVYAHRTAHGFQLETAAMDGSGMLPLSYMQASALPAQVLADGRILFEAGFPLGSGATPELFLVYSDGSGVESYRCDHGVARWGGRQLASGDVVFTHGPTLARFTSPLAHEASIAAPRGEYAGAIAETPSGAWLVSARRGEAGAHFALKLWKPGAANSAAAGMQTVLAQKGADLVEPVLILPRDRPRRHPSGLHEWSYANMLALDARQSRDGALKTAPASVRLEAMDPNGHAVALGTAPVEADGSFFVRTPADQPIRFALLDKTGATLRQERGWFWIRGGEQRICVGCHVGPERASENRVPAVLLRTTTPVDLSGVNPAGDAHRTSPGGNR
jgi:hypothetical protein